MYYTILTLNLWGQEYHKVLGHGVLCMFYARFELDQLGHQRHS